MRLSERLVAMEQEFNKLKTMYRDLRDDKTKTDTNYVTTMITNNIRKIASSNTTMRSGRARKRMSCSLKESRTWKTKSRRPITPISLRLLR